MQRLTTFVLAHRRSVMAAWLLLTIAGFATLGSTTNRLSTEFKLPGQPSYIADSKIQALYHNGTQTVPIVVAVTGPAGQAADPAVADKVLAAASAAVPGSRFADQYNTGDRAFSTKSGQTTFGLIFTPRESNGFKDTRTPAVTAAAQAATPSGWTSGVTGLAQLENGGSSKGSSALTETMLGAVGSLAVLGFVFASFIALVPLLMAIVAIPTTFLIVGGLTHVTSVSIIVEFLIALIGLGVAIDYSLLVVTRWREERAHGYDNHEAIARAMNTAGRAVVFSGLTVGVSLLALVVLPVSFLANIGIAGFLIPIVSIAVALTLLPALLASAGPFLDRPRLRREVHASRPWSAWARLVLRHRNSGAFIGAAILLALIIPVFAINLGEPKTSALAQTGAAHATLTSLQQGGVPSGVIEPIDVLVQDSQAQAVASKLSEVKGVYTAAVSNASDFHRGGTTIVEVLASGEPSSSPGGATIAAVRSTASHLPGVIGVGGAGPGQVDFINAVYGSFPLMLTLIGIATLLLLTRAFRSIVLAAKAVIFNMMSVAAAYGIMVFVWQEGHGSNALWSVPATGSITVWVPIMVFAFLFGLSMDYEVFILSRIREEYDRTGSTDGAVVTGIGRTGRLVTSAALILFLGFLSLSTAGMTDLKVMATGLGAGILLDAVVVRSLLVPSLVGVLGKWNWYLPDWMARALFVRTPPAIEEFPPAGETPVLVGAGER
ncbi:MAG TPA: MMPL family transporter [Acidimicrobiales bacterium]|nr:MMPL family transporter [Acidimicrobiales bacterium]